MARRSAVLHLAFACLLGAACGGSSPSPSGGGTPGGGPKRFAVAVAATGSGRIMSTPAGIDCGTVCSASFDAGTHLSLVAAPLILLGAPALPLLYGIPRLFKLRSQVARLLRSRLVRALGRVCAQPAICWTVAIVVFIGWHLPPLFQLGLRSEGWHAVEHASFLGSGLMFWWPVVQPWPSTPKWPRWSVPLYLFAAILPCDGLSAFLAFSDRVVYPAYLSTPRHFGLSVLQDQECAGALMWLCVTIAYVIPAAIVTTKLLSPCTEAVATPLRTDLFSNFPRDGENVPVI